MSNFEHPDNPDLELPLEALKSIRDELAKALILHGSVSDGSPDKALEGEPVPHEFEYVFDDEGKAMLAKLAFPEDGVTVLAAKAVESTPRDDVPDDPDPNLGKTAHGVSLVIDGVLHNDLMHTMDRTEIRVSYGIFEHYYSGEMDAWRNVEYLQHHKWINPNGDRQVTSDMTDEDMLALLDDRGALDHWYLTLEDGEIFHAAAKYISTRPQRD